MAIDGKVVAITGASSGIGRAAALHLSRKGARLVLAARRQGELATVAAEAIRHGGQAIYQATDVTRREDLEALVALALEGFGRLDVMVSNAGIGPISRFDALQVDDWERMIDVNVKGVLYGIAAVLPVFRRQQAGHFVNVVSTAGLKIVPAMGVYAAAKNAVRTITEALRQEAGPHLRVTEISPGMIATDFSQSMTDPALRASMARLAGEIGIAPDAVAQGIAFAIEQPADVDVGSIVIRPTAQD